jgi:hypothetical protein
VVDLCTKNSINSFGADITDYKKFFGEECFNSLSKSLFY